MQIKDITRLKVGDKPSHLARFEKAFDKKQKTVLDIACPDCSSPPGDHCKGDFS